MLILGHRGASHDRPENTLEAFAEALAQGADGIELDVQRCRSGELVVCHDEVLTRLAGVGLEITRTDWARLASVDVGSTLGFAPARLPLLEQVFERVPGEKLINVELKCDTADDHGLSVAVADFLESIGRSGSVRISSFNPLCLLRIHQRRELSQGYLIDPDHAWWPQANLWLPMVGRDAVHPHFSQVTPERVEAWKSKGLKIAVWTVDDPTEAKRLRELGIDELITNEPGKLRAALG